MHSQAHAMGASLAFRTLLALQTVAQVVLGVFALLALAGVDTMAPARGWRAYTGVQVGLHIVVLGATIAKFTLWSRVNTAVKTFVWATVQHVLQMALALVCIMAAVEEGHTSGLIPDGAVWFDGTVTNVWKASSIAALWYIAMILVVSAAVGTVRHAAVTARAMLRAVAAGKTTADHNEGVWATGDSPPRSEDDNPGRVPTYAVSGRAAVPRTQPKRRK